MQAILSLSPALSLCLITLHSPLSPPTLQSHHSYPYNIHTHTLLCFSLPSYFATPPPSPNTRIPIAPCLNWCLRSYRSHHPTATQQHDACPSSSLDARIAALQQERAAVLRQATVQSGLATAVQLVVTQQSSIRCSKQSTRGEMATHSRASAHPPVCE